MYHAALWSSTIAIVPYGLSQCSRALFALVALAPPAEPVAVVFASSDPIFIAVGSLAHPVSHTAPASTQTDAAVLIVIPCRNPAEKYRRPMPSGQRCGVSRTAPQGRVAEYREPFAFARRRRRRWRFRARAGPLRKLAPRRPTPAR